MHRTQHIGQENGSQAVVTVNCNRVAQEGDWSETNDYILTKSDRGLYVIHQFSTNKWATLITGHDDYLALAYASSSSGWVFRRSSVVALTPSLVPVERYA